MNAARWLGRFDVGEGYAIYEGPAGESRPHAHAAFQITIGTSDEVTIDDGVALYRAPAIVTAPMARHRLVPPARVRIFYIEPQSAFAGRLRERYGKGVTPAPDLHLLTEEQIGQASTQSAQPLDSRLLAVISAMSLPGAPPTLSESAKMAGLSPQRLRALASEQLGMPLARWRIWQRLKQASAAMNAGESLSAAAQSAGFADQAHFSREMRAMFGITPSTVLQLMRAQTRRAV